MIFVRPTKWMQLSYPIIQKQRNHTLCPSEKWNTTQHTKANIITVEVNDNQLVTDVTCQSVKSDCLGVTSLFTFTLTLGSTPWVLCACFSGEGGEVTKIKLI